MKAKVKTIIVRDKIYFNESDVEDMEYLKNIYTYNTGLDFISTIERYPSGLCAVPSNSFWKIEAEKVIDERTWKDLHIPTPFTQTLRSDQKEVVDGFFKAGRLYSGILTAKPGWGKTFTACKIIEESKATTLILVHTKLLLHQWIDHLNNLLPNIPIGIAGDNQFKLEDITVGLYQTVSNNVERFQDRFGLCFVDEVHHCPAEVFCNTVNSINTRVKIGISATPRRKDYRHIVFDDLFTRHRVIAKDITAPKDILSEIIQTPYGFPLFSLKRDWAKQMTKLGSNASYINLISTKAKSDIADKRCILILSERINMLEALHKTLPRSALLIGATSKETREDIITNAGIKYDVILSTKIMDEAISIYRLDTLYFTCPSNNPILWEQRIGRIERDHPEKQRPKIVDFWLKGHIVARQQANRLAYYNEKGYEVKEISI